MVELRTPIKQWTESDQKQTQVLIVDDHALIRLGLRQMIETQPHLNVCAEAASIDEAKRCFEQYNPDLVITDITLADGSGIELIRQFTALRPDIKILVVSMHDEFLFADRALRAGAKGYLRKDQAIDRVREAIDTVMRDRVYLSEDMAERMLLRVVNPHQHHERPMDLLSNRELEIFEMIGRGMTRGELARTLHLSVKTIESHQANIKRKLKLRSNQEMFRRAVEWLIEGE